MDAFAGSFGSRFCDETRGQNLGLGAREVEGGVVVEIATAVAQSYETGV
jgi:hypothetical protein